MLSASKARYVIVDLDGPILEGRCRHYECYRQILLDHGFAALPIDTYWRMKRRGTSARGQLAATGAESLYDQFRAIWLARIEAPELLALDQLQPGAADTLRRWHEVEQVSLVLATLRQREAGVHEQLQRFELTAMWNSIVVCASEPGAAEKQQHVANALGRTDGERCLWIGDTEVDVQAARAFGCPVWAVSCGLRDQAFLRELSPDRLSESISHIDLREYMPPYQRT